VPIAGPAGATWDPPLLQPASIATAAETPNAYLANVEILINKAPFPT